MNRHTLQKLLHGKINSPDIGFPVSSEMTRSAAVLIPFVEYRDFTTILLTQRSRHLKDHPGQISFPGGGMDPGDDSPAHTAQRETHEELGIAPELIEVWGSLEPVETGTGFLVSPMLGFLKPPLHYSLQADEVDDAFEVPLEHFLDPRNHKTHSLVYKGQERDFWAMPYEDRFIWGATAYMLRCLYELITGDKT